MFNNNIGLPGCVYLTNYMYVTYTQTEEAKGHPCKFHQHWLGVLEF